MISICAVRRALCIRNVYFCILKKFFKFYFFDRLIKEEKKNILTQEMGRNRQRVINRFQFITNRHSKTLFIKFEQHHDYYWLPQSLCNHFDPRREETSKIEEKFFSSTLSREFHCRFSSLLFIPLINKSHSSCDSV